MTLSYMRGRKRQIVGRGGHSSAEDADRGAMAGGGRGTVAAHEMKQEIETTGPKKRKRSQNDSDLEEEQMPLDDPSGNDKKTSDEPSPELGTRMIYALGG
jgi:hypothetical protein